MSNILLSGAHTALAYKLKRFLPAQGVLLGDFEPLPALPGNAALFVQLPSPASPSYVHDFLKVCLSADISLVYVIRRAEMVLLSASKHLFAEYGIELALPISWDFWGDPKFTEQMSKEIKVKPDGFYWVDVSDTEFLFICD
ncbi:MAG: hypothetical protein ACKOW2_08880 [Sphingobacteriaceae bacterium]